MRPYRLRRSGDRRRRTVLLAAPVEREWFPLSAGDYIMLLSLAQDHAFELARSLMTCVILFETGCAYGVMPARDYDGDASRIVCEYDPFEL